MSELSSSSKGEGGVFLAEGTACTKAWQQNPVYSSGSCKWCGLARVGSKLGERGVRLGDKEGSWVSVL